MTREELARSILLYASSGELPVSQSGAVLRSLLAEGAGRPAPQDLIEALVEPGDRALLDLSTPLREGRRRQAARHFHLRRQSQLVPEDLKRELSDLPLDPPLGWTTLGEGLRRFQSALRLVEDRLALEARKDLAPALFSAVQEKEAQSAAFAASLDTEWGAGPLGEVLAELEKKTGPLEALRRRIGEKTQGEAQGPGGLAARYAQATAREERREILDRICTWPTDRAAGALASLELEPWAQERAQMILTLRFGPARKVGWDAWRPWLESLEAARTAPARSLGALGQKHPAAVLYLWYSRKSGPDPEVLRLLEHEILEGSGPFRLEEFAERWASVIPPLEWRALAGRELPLAALPQDEATREAPSLPAVPSAPPLPPSPPDRVPSRPKSRAAAPPLPPSRPAEPSVWEKHLKPFILANWYMIAGVVMVVVGSSLLAYYTWDKHWLIRYSLMPMLLGAFTAGLAWLGGWIERRDAHFNGTAAVLRSAAIGLLPVNFMAIALLANDPQIVSSQKALAVPLLGAVYVGFFGWSLGRWCRAVHPPMGWLLAGTLLFLNALVTLAPLARSMGAGPRALQTVTAGGFYLGFLAAAATVFGFTRRILTAELAQEKRVPWFFGAALSVTFLQVFAWVHGYLELVPRGFLYAPMVTLAGGLILSLERRTLELRGQGDRHGAESFLGFAFILLGLLLGMPSPGMRIVTFVLAGSVWIRQSLRRQEAVHAWIGLTLLSIGIASVALLDGIPLLWRPASGIGAALVMGAVARLFRAEPRLEGAARGMQASLLLLTFLVLPVHHWVFKTPPGATAGMIAVIAALLAWRGWRDARIAWIQTSMVVLALALPYLSKSVRPALILAGLAGLSWLWIGASSLSRSPLLRGARSTVLWIYGFLALASVAIEGPLGAGPEPDALRWGGLAGMIGALLAAAWFSRSLVPSAMAMVLGAVLASAVRGRLRLLYPHHAWGSGLDSAIVAVGLILAAFAFRKRLKPFAPGDRYLGRAPYPLSRLDHTLFTWPLLAGALLLTVKVEAWNLLGHWAGSGVTVPVSIAVGISAAAWTLLGIYHRAHPAAVAGSYLGLFWLMVAGAFGVPGLVPAASWPQTALFEMLALQGLFFLYRFGLAGRHPWAGSLLATPAENFIRIGSVGLSAVLIGALGLGEGPADLGWLIPVVLAQLTWQALSRKALLFGSFLALTLWTTLVAWTTPGSGLLADRFWVARALAPSLWMVLGIQVLQAALEPRRALYEFLRPVAVPFQTLAVLLVVGLAGIGIRDGLLAGGVPPGIFALLLTSLLLTARALGSGPLALLGAAVAYLFVHSGVRGDRWAALVDPWHASLLALGLATLAHAGRVLHRKAPKLLKGAFAPALPTGPASLWLFLPAGAIACLTSLVHSVDPALRDSRIELLAPYLGACTLGILAASLGRIPLFYGTGALLTLGNIHLMRTLPGDLLRSGGLSEPHRIALGLALTLLQVSALRRLIRREDLSRMAARSSLVWAGLILALLSANYLVHPNLASIGPVRFGVSGALALLAGQYFRRAARRSGEGEERMAAWCEGFYHFGTTLALWCAALMVPVLRSPVTALVALGFPVIYFWARSEFGSRERYVPSAATLGFLVLALYALRPLFQMVIFPEVPVETGYYHRNSPFIFLLGLVLMRLRALGGTEWLTFYGGLAVMGSVFFALTALPGLSPFHHPVESAGCALALAHFFTLASVQRSPLRTALARWSGLDAPGWQALRRPWGMCLLAASQAMAFYGCLEFQTRPLMVAPLVAGAASVWIHQGILRQSGAYGIVARVLIVLALHAGLVLESYLPAGHIVWALLGIWLALLMVDLRVPVPGLAGHALTLGGLVLAHVLFRHRPDSPVGLAAVALAAVLAGLTPRLSRAPTRAGESVWAGVLPWVPAWLVGWSQARSGGTWGILAGAGAVLATGAAAWMVERSGIAAPGGIGTRRPRLWDQSLHLLGSRGRTVFSAALGISWATVSLASICPLAWSWPPLGPRELALTLGLFGALVVAWILEGLSRRSPLPYFMAQASALAGFVVARAELLVPRLGWQTTHDLWVSLGTFLVLSAILERLNRRREDILVPLRAGILALPAFSIVWALLHPPGTDLGLLLVGLHSAAFAFLGREDRESPYHVVAVGGFVAFILLLFWSKFHLREVYAYSVPVGTGVLILLQLFARRVSPDVRMGVRAGTLLAMLASAGYYCLVDPGFPLVHNLSLIVLSLGAMGLGGLLRVRLYLALGFGALMIDLVALFVKMVVHMERSVKMTLVGSTVLVVGAGLIVGTIWVKTHPKEIAGALERWRFRFAGWE